jgi:hydroxylamine reductase
MFCYQCEQTAQGTGCTKFGVCGKAPNTSALQDLVVHSVKGISRYAHRLRQMSVTDHEADLYAVEALFTTVTNVNFDPAAIADWVRRGVEITDRLEAVYGAACKKAGKQPEDLRCPQSRRASSGTVDELVAQAEAVSYDKAIAKFGADVAGLQNLILFGLKGMAAYADHAQVLGQEDDAVYAFLHEALDFLAGSPTDVDALVKMTLRVGEVNMRVMELLDAGNTGTYGHPEPTEVRTTPVKGKCIVVSGHDLADLEALLKQTEGKGVNVYTHGEMLPCLAYPGLKKYKHLVGNYGTAWQNQAKEFDAFPGAILMTTNCIQKPKDSYMGRIFTSGLVEWPGAKHVSKKDYSAVIAAALAAPGFTEDAPAKTIMVGFGRQAVMNVAGPVIDAVKAGAIKRFFLVGGCDGAKPGRNYFTEFAHAVPKDCVILTLACGKYRFNMAEDYGNIGGIPRLLDMGQCNDAYSAIQVAVALAGAFNCGVNDLPLSFVVSWYEQKAVVILLTLLHLGIKDIRLGPSLPAFIGPNVLDVLVKNFNIMPTTTAAADMKAIMG